MFHGMQLLWNDLLGMILGILVLWHPAACHLTCCYWNATPGMFFFVLCRLFHSSTTQASFLTARACLNAEAAYITQRELCFREGEILDRLARSSTLERTVLQPLTIRLAPLVSFPSS